MVSRTLLLTVLFAIAIGFGAAAYSLMVGGAGGRSSYASAGGGERGGERGSGFLGNFGGREGGYDSDD